MKKILFVCFMLVSNMVVADTVGWMANNGGGKIVLTDKDCQSDSRQFMAYASSASIGTQFGCWFSDDAMVHITWESTETLRSYPLEQWNINSEVAKRLRQRLKSSGNIY